jgi:hypothetical protein
MGKAKKRAAAAGDDGRGESKSANPKVVIPATLRVRVRCEKDHEDASPWIRRLYVLFRAVDPNDAKAAGQEQPPTGAASGAGGAAGAAGAGGAGGGTGEAAGAAGATGASGAPPRDKPTDGKRADAKPAKGGQAKKPIFHLGQTDENGYLSAVKTELDPHPTQAGLLTEKITYEFFFVRHPEVGLATKIQADLTKDDTKWDGAPPQRIEPKRVATGKDKAKKDVEELIVTIPETPESYVPRGSALYKGWVLFRDMPNHPCCRDQVVRLQYHLGALRYWVGNHGNPYAPIEFPVANKKGKTPTVFGPNYGILYDAPGHKGIPPSVVTWNAIIAFQHDGKGGHAKKVDPSLIAKLVDPASDYQPTALARTFPGQRGLAEEFVTAEMADAAKAKFEWPYLSVVDRVTGDAIKNWIDSGFRKPRDVLVNFFGPESWMNSAVLPSYEQWGSYLGQYGALGKPTSGGDSSKPSPSPKAKIPDMGKVPDAPEAPPKAERLPKADTPDEPAEEGGSAESAESGVSDDSDTEDTPKVSDKPQDRRKAPRVPLNGCLRDPRIGVETGHGQIATSIHKSGFALDIFQALAGIPSIDDRLVTKKGSSPNLFPVQYVRDEQVYRHSLGAVRDQSRDLHPMTTHADPRVTREGQWRWIVYVRVPEEHIPKDLVVPLHAADGTTVIGYRGKKDTFIEYVDGVAQWQFDPHSPEGGQPADRPVTVAGSYFLNVTKIAHQCGYARIGPHAKGWFEEELPEEVRFDGPRKLREIARRLAAHVHQAKKNKWATYEFSRKRPSPADAPKDANGKEAPPTETIIPFSALNGRQVDFLSSWTSELAAYDPNPELHVDPNTKEGEAILKVIKDRTRAKKDKKNKKEPWKGYSITVRKEPRKTKAETDGKGGPQKKDGGDQSAGDNDDAGKADAKTADAQKGGADDAKDANKKNAEKEPLPEPETITLDVNTKFPITLFTIKPVFDFDLKEGDVLNFPDIPAEETSHLEWWHFQWVKGYYGIPWGQILLNVGWTEEGLLGKGKDIFGHHGIGYTAEELAHEEPTSIDN